MKLVDANWGQDERTRERIRTDLDTSMLVEAAAGTGKTTQLVGRLVATLAAGRATVDEIVAVTFTRKAAGELKLRLREELEEARAREEDPEVRGRLEDAVAHLEETRIGTIHSFCADLLRARPVEAGVDPGFVEVADDEGPQLFARAFDRWMQEQLEEMPEGLRRALARLALETGWFGGVRSTPLERLREAGWALAEWRDHPAPWKQPPFDRQPLIDRLVRLVARLASHARRADHPRDPLRRGLEPVELLDTWIRRAGFRPRDAGVDDVAGDLPEGVLVFPSGGGAGARQEGDGTREPSARSAGELADEDYDALEARLLELRRELRKPWNRQKGRGRYAQALPREQVLEERDLFLECLDHFQRVADADLAALLQRELSGVLDRYEAVKRAEGRLDFSDLLLCARDLLVNAPSVRRELQQQIRHVFIDEFQDTDAVQAEVLLLLVADDPDCDDWRRVRPAPGKLFAVGDPKQSIYRFRRADVRLYESIKERLRTRGVAILDLGRSFRSNAAIQHFVNAAFAPEMDGDAEAGRPHYLPLGEFRPAPGDRPGVVVLPVPRPYNWKQVTQKEIQASEAEVVPAFCEWLLRESGWTVGRDAPRPIRPGDICILFRRYLSWGHDVTRPYVQGLEDRGITHLLIGARTFHHREEVETMRAALQAIEWPDDELATFATLRGSLFSFGDDTLLRFRHAIGGARAPFTALSWRRFVTRGGGDESALEALPDDLRDVGVVLDGLLRLHRLRNRRAVVETVQELLDWTRARAGFALRPAGHQVLANVERVCELARSYELSGGRSFRGFVEQLEEEASRPSSTQAPVVEDGADGVRIMTVHGAKGLEFPVVILADMTCGLARARPSQAVEPEQELCAQQLLGCSPLDLIEREEVEAERDRAEAVRVAYVAATRAEDLLVVPAVGDGERQGWLEPLNRAMFPADPRAAVEAPGCPPFGDRSVLERPMKVEQAMAGESSVRPGLHRITTDGGARADVVWFDPAVLRLDAEPEFGLAREELLVGDEPRGDGGAGEAGAADVNRDRYGRWQRRREEVTGAASVPSRSVVAVTGIESPPPGGLREVEVVDLARPAGTAAGMRFGDLVHSVLRLLDLRLPAEQAERQGIELCALQARVLGATPEEQAAAVGCVRRLVESELGARLRMADGVWREFPVAARLELPEPSAEGPHGAADAPRPPAASPTVVDAVVDLLFRDGDGLTLVDFKTDARRLETATSADGEDALGRYRRQLSWYAEVLAASGNLRALAGEAGVTGVTGGADGEDGQERDPELRLLLVQL